MIALSAAPTAAFTANDFTPPLLTNVLFTDQSVRFTDHRLWDFSDGDTARSQNPVHAYQNPGTYTVTPIAFTCNGPIRSPSRSPLTLLPRSMSPARPQRQCAMR